MAAQTDEQKDGVKHDELKIFGYLRDVMNVEREYNHYNDIILIIIEYSKQGFARYEQNGALVDYNYCIPTHSNPSRFQLKSFELFENVN